MRNFEEYSACRICPHECGVNRFESLGFCRTDGECRTASVCVHRGEEPVIGGKRGICNVFFAHCNLQCSYCQNHEISVNKTSLHRFYSYDVTLRMIFEILKTGIEAVGFVSPSHQVPVVRQLISDLHDAGFFPTMVYNSSAYDPVDSLKTLERLIDVYLPDFKYSDSDLSFKLSGVRNYPEKALAAIKEMFRQIGTSVVVNKDGRAERGLIVRHLVIPGFAENTQGVLKTLSKEISPKIHISLMSQYYPARENKIFASLNRTLNPEEYAQAMQAAEESGFYRGWFQDLESPQLYRPDFTKEHPFENL